MQEFIVAEVMSAVACATILYRRGTSPWGGALLGVLLSFPVGILVAVVFFKPRPPVLDEWARL